MAPVDAIKVSFSLEFRLDSVVATVTMATPKSTLEIIYGWLVRTHKNGQGAVLLRFESGQQRVVLRSEQYDAKASASNGIASVQKNSPDEARYERNAAKDGRCYFNLKAGNHQIIGTSQMYKDESGRDNGIKSVQTNGPSTTVKDLS